MKTFKQSTLLLYGILLLAATSCKKTDITPISSTSANSTSNLSGNDKLVLSKVTGSIESDFPLFSPFLLNLYYTYTWNNDVYELGPNKGNFQKTFTYGNDKNSGTIKNLFNRKHF